MNRLLALAAVPTFALAAVLGLATSAAADVSPVQLPITVAAWYWDRPQSPADVPGVPAEAEAQASGVPAGSVAVAYRGGADGAPEKEAYLVLDTASVPADAIVSFAELRLPLTTGATQQQPPTGPAPLVACVPKAAPKQAAGAAFSVKPADDCSTPVTARYEETSTSYVFDLAPLISKWQGNNTGLAIRPPVGYVPPDGLPFQVVLDPKAAVTTVVAAPLDAPVVAAPESPAGGSGSPATAPFSGSTSGVDLPAAPVSGPGVPTSPPTPAVASTSGPQPAAVTRGAASAPAAKRSVGRAVAAGLGAIVLVVAVAAAAGDSPRSLLAAATSRRRAAA
jgi:hypothetical protein